MKTNEQLGLSAAEVLRSRAEHGENVLTPPKRQSMWILYLEKYQDPMVRILLVAAMVSLVLSFVKNDFMETIGIIAAIILATTVGFLFERDAARKFDVLTQLGEEQSVKVVRDGEIVEIPRREVVVGDVVIIETGDEVPADGMLLQATDLQVDESSLTGELLTNKECLSPDCSPKDNGSEMSGDKTQEGEEAYPKNMLLRSSMVMNGTGRMMVTAVGDHTEIGHVARQATELTGVKTPLNQQLNRLAKLISKVGGGLSMASFVIFLIHDMLTSPLWHTTDYAGMLEVTLRYFMMAVTLIVMAVPEGLPMAITLALALNMRRMLKSNNLVRKLQASETMGAVTVICTDKTGTLTANRMTVFEIRNENGEMSNDVSPELTKAIALNTTATHNVGNPTEQALLRWLMDQGIDYQQLREEHPITDRLPFSTERKYMTTTAEDTLYIKGAPEVVMDFLESRGEQIEGKDEIQATLLDWQQHALRTLAIAWLPNTQHPTPITHHPTPNTHHPTPITPPRHRCHQRSPASRGSGSRTAVQPSRYRCESGDRRHLGNSYRDSPPDRHSASSWRYSRWHRDNGQGLCRHERRRGTEIRARAKGDVASQTYRQAATGTAATAARRGRGSNGRRHERCSGAEPLARRSVVRFRHQRCPTSQRHYAHRRLFPQHRTGCHVGTFALQEHPALHLLPASRQRHGTAAGALRSLHRYGDAADHHADSVGKPHHGHLCRHGVGFAASQPRGDEREAPQPRRLHHHSSHGTRHLHHWRTVLCCHGLHALVFRACGRSR